VDLRTVRHTVRDKYFHLVFFGDPHVGVIHCAEERLREDVSKVVEMPDCRAIFLGDLADCINLSDRRFDPRAIKPDYPLSDLEMLPQARIEDLEALIAPLVLGQQELDRTMQTFMGRDLERKSEIQRLEARVAELEAQLGKAA